MVLLVRIFPFFGHNMVGTVMASMGLQHGVEAPNEGFDEDHSSGTGFRVVRRLGVDCNPRRRSRLGNESLVKTIQVTQVRVFVARVSMVAIVFKCEVTTLQTAFAPTFDLHVNCPLFVLCATFDVHVNCLCPAARQILDFCC